MTRTPTVRDEVVTYLALLEKHKGLIAEVFRDGSILHDPSRGKELSVLTQHRILTVTDDLEYRLVPALHKSISYALQRSGTFAANDDLRPRLGAIDRLRTAYLVSVAQVNLLDEQETLKDDFLTEVFDLGHEISRRIDEFQVLVETRFGNVSSLALKLSQNRYYVEQAVALTDYVNAIENSKIYEELCKNVVLEDLRRHYEKCIHLHLSRWRAALMDVTHRLEVNFSALKRVQPRLNRLRLLSKYLKTNPAYLPPGPGEIQTIPEWMRRVPPLVSRGHPDFNSHQVASDLAEMAGKVKAGPATARKRGAVTMAPDGTQLPEGQDVVLSPGYEALQKLIYAAALNPAPTRAIAWLNQYAAEQGKSIDPEAWLLYALYCADGRSDVKAEYWKAVRVRPIEDSEDKVSLWGNRRYVDIELTSRIKRIREMGQKTAHS